MTPKRTGLPGFGSVTALHLVRAADAFSAATCLPARRRGDVDQAASVKRDIGSLGSMPYLPSIAFCSPSRSAPADAGSLIGRTSGAKPATRFSPTTEAGPMRAISGSGSRLRHPCDWLNKAIDILWPARHYRAMETVCSNGRISLLAATSLAGCDAVSTRSGTVTTTSSSCVAATAARHAGAGMR
ncbi:MAG: hypothetical protein AVDCRST_MAG42-2499 [uncultured Chthoniobacterales bacterium]|uniref:Uncharacterized protein n=1 Tax=uncultured Chthoniobacterales bacterium TaxID=1836801 RepID=A0A6J4IQ90_9BACT|nr:MAG: hypothetical protein AVDCRST_MAG42-2499 [uncultured Chthoniobacterales bacterium]